MSMISKDGYEQILVIRNALNSMYEKLDKTVYTKVKPTKNDDVNYKSTNVFQSVQDEFEAIAGIVEEVGTWVEVQDGTRK